MIKYVKSIDRTTTEKNYTPNTGLKRIQFSNNVSSYGMVSSENGLMIPNGLRTQLKSVNINGNCTNLIDGCFMDCKNLSSVNIPYTCTEFGASAFMNCENLEDINILHDPNFIIQHTGDRCFANCSKLTDISVNLATGVSKSYGSNTFENCKNLKDVTFVKGGSSYLCPYMFNGCDSLTGVHIDSTNTTYTSEGAFSNLKSLKEIYLPKNIQSVQEEFFKDDINLEKVEFEDTDPNVGLQSILEDAFNGCAKLKSLTLPQTIKDFSQIDRNAFNNAELTSVYFNGMDSTMFVDEVPGIDIAYDLGKWYGTTDYYGIDSYGKVWKGHRELSTIQANKVNKTINDLLNLNNLSGVPILLFQGNPCCGNCERFEEIISQNISKLHELGNILILGTTINQSIRDRLKTGLRTGTFPYLTFKYTDKYGKTHVYHRNDNYLKAGDLNGVSEIRTFADLKKWIPNEAKTIVDTTKIRYEQKQNLSLFGLDKPYCYYFDKDGNKYKVLSSETDRAYTDQVIEYNINSDVSSNFKYGTWFSNSKRLKEFADINKIPVLIEYGEPVRCPPCKEFKRKIFNNDKFQEWVKNRPYLFCCIEADEEPTFHVNGTNEHYVMHEWCRTVPLDQREPDYSPNQIIPVMAWYWNSPNGLIKDVHSLHGSGVMNLNMNMDEIMKKTDDLFSSYNRNNVFNRIEQTEITTNDGKFAGFVYSNQDGDENGTWFDVSTRDRLNEIPRTIDINGYKIITSLKVGDDSEFSDGTYMYRDFQDGLYNKQGIIFKVQSSKIAYIYRYTRKSSDIHEDHVKGKYDFKKWYVIKSESDIEQFNSIINDADELDFPVVLFQAKGFSNTLPKQLYDIVSSDEFGLRMNFKNMYFIAVDTNNTKVNTQLKTFITKGKTTKSGKTGYSSYSQSNNRLFCYQNCINCGGDVNKPSIATELKLDKNTTIENFLDFVTKSFDIEKLNKGDPIVDPEPET